MLVCQGALVPIRVAAWGLAAIHTDPQDRVRLRETHTEPEASIRPACIAEGWHEEDTSAIYAASHCKAACNWAAMCIGCRNVAFADVRQVEVRYPAKLRLKMAI